jgi:rfaE bifunctional protein nucleotidyltransferase chain/domain
MGEENKALNNELADLVLWSTLIKSKGGIIVATNGCFDILHVGHIRMIEEARHFGDFVVVGLNSDASVRRLKGDGRPVNPQEHRREVLRALRWVDVVTIFHTPTADGFLRCCKPDVYVKAGDYSFDTMNPLEKQALQEMGTKIHFTPYVGGISTTNILGRLNG